MKIGIDASWACGRKTGTGRFVCDLVRSLAQCDSTNEYALYFRECCRERNPLFALERSHSRVHNRVVDSRLNLFRMWIALSIAGRRDALDVFLSPAFFLPLFGGFKKVVVFQDMNVYKLPSAWLRKGVRLNFLALRTAYVLSARSADRIVTISASSKNDLAAVFPRAAGKCVTITPGFDPSRISIGATISEEKARPFFLFVGVMSPTKNIERIVKAFAAFKRTQNADCELILVGRDSGRHMVSTVRPLIESLGLEKDVKWKGFVDDRELASLYGGAVAVLLPSLIEGWGYPILEGMAAGKAVITSNVTSCPEVAGDAAICVDPYSIRAIADAMAAVYSDPDLRRRLVEKGFVRAREFRPAEAAARYMELFASLCGPSGGQAR